MSAYFSKSVLFRCCRVFSYNRSRTHFSNDVGEIPKPASKTKKTRSSKELSTEEKKKLMINWHKTNQMLFGPVVEEKKIKKKKVTEKLEKQKQKSAEKVNGALIPISIWQNIDPDSLRARKIICHEKVDDAVIKNAGHTNTTIKDKPSAKRKSNSSRLANSSLNSDETTTKNDTNLISDMPKTPFYVQEGISYPFPLIINKAKSTPTAKNIYSLTSQRLAIPSVTEVLSKTRSEGSELALATWRKKKIAEVGEEGLEEFMKETKLTGTSLHTSIEACLRGVPYENVSIDSRISGHWLSLKTILKEVNDVVAIESHVTHPFLQYKGFVDCVAHYEGSLAVIDWKTSQRIKTTLAAAYDDPVQIAAYMGALNADSNYHFEVEKAVIVVAYPTGRPADVLALNREECEQYWVEWLKRLELYDHRKKQGLLDSPLYTS